jgi:hypothetical protein
MKKSAKILLLTMLIGLTGCNIFPGNEAKTNTLDIDVKDAKFNNTPVLINQGLPVQKLVITSQNGKHEFEVEIAAKDNQRKVGLMNRDHLDDDKGMLFVFETSGIVNFWMKNTLIPLDMLFINEHGVIETIARNVQPCTKTPCPLYNSYKSVKFVLEINGGKADHDGIKEGDQATWLQ